MQKPEEIWRRAGCSIALKIFRLGNRPQGRIVPIDPGNVPRLDRAYIQRTAKELIGQGFRDLGYLRVDAGAGQAGDGLRYRLLGSEQGDICAIISVVRPKRTWGMLLHLWMRLRGRLRPPLQFLEFSTSLDNGAVIDTSNSSGRNPFTNPPDHRTLRVPNDTPLAVQLATHRREVATALQQHPGVEVTRVLDLDAYDRIRVREIQVRNHYRQSIGYATDAEIRGLSGPNYELVRHHVRAELDRLAKDGNNATDDVGGSAA